MPESTQNKTPIAEFNSQLDDALHGVTITQAEAPFRRHAHFQAKVFHAVAHLKVATNKAILAIIQQTDKRSKKNLVNHVNAALRIGLVAGIYKRLGYGQYSLANKHSRDAKVFSKFVPNTKKPDDVDEAYFDGLALLQNNSKKLFKVEEILTLGHLGCQSGSTKAEVSKEFWNGAWDIEKFSSKLHVKIDKFVAEILNQAEKHAQYRKFASKHITKATLDGINPNCILIYRYLVGRGKVDLETLQAKFPAYNLTPEKLSQWGFRGSYEQYQGVWYYHIDNDFFEEFFLYNMKILEEFKPNLNNPSKVDDMYFDCIALVKDLQRELINFGARIVASGEIIDENLTDYIAFVKSLIHRCPKLLTQTFEANKTPNLNVMLIPAVYSAIERGKRLKLTFRGSVTKIIQPTNLLFENKWILTTEDQTYQLDKVVSARLAST